MKKSIYMICIVCLMIILSGCNNEEDNEIIGDEELFEKVENSDEYNTGEIKKSTEEEGEHLGEISELNSKNAEEKIVGDVAIEKEIEYKEKCEEGFVYNTELNECFKNGGSVNVEEVEIDPIVKECNDRGGIYNAQIEKCFID